MRILVVEDDRELASILERALAEQLYAVEVAHDGETARHLAITEEYSAILLDLMIPGIDGVAVCRAIREAGKQTPVVMLTARDAIGDRVQGLDAGADDYVVKPFAMEELLARVRAQLRRASSRPTNVVTVGRLSLDPRSTHVRYGSRRVELTAKEFALLHFLMLHPDEVVSRAEILEGVWDANYSGFGNVVEVYMNYLRNKLESCGEPRIIETVRGRGYLLRSAQDGIAHEGI
jgi:DNA-binding response OmpR family regulator